MEHGIVKDWNDMERIWQYVYSKDQLQTFSEEVSGLCAEHSCAGCQAGCSYTPDDEDENGSDNCQGFESKYVPALGCTLCR